MSTGGEAAMDRADRGPRTLYHRAPPCIPSAVSMRASRSGAYRSARSTASRAKEPTSKDNGRRHFYFRCLEVRRGHRRQFARNEFLVADGHADREK